MKYEPHAYQQYAIEYIKSHPVAAILLGCGLGKTSITLSAIADMLASGEIRKVLVVAPIRVAQLSWPDEITKWDHLRHLRYSVAVGNRDERIAALQSEADIYIINRENLPWLIDECVQPFDYDMCVLDELSSFKNWQSKRFRAFMKVRPKLKRVVGLTGTPSSNGLMDLFAEYRCLDMGKRLGRFIGQYRDSFFRPDKFGSNVVYSYKPLPGAESQIYERIGDITISMKSTDFLDMPELVTSTRRVVLDRIEREHYEELRRELVLKLNGAEVTAANAAALSNKLVQLANGAVYTDDGETVWIHDRKIDALEDIIEAANGQPILVAYWYKHDLARIEERLKRLNLRFARLDTDEHICGWNEGMYDVCLIHPASAGHGLNLQAGGSTIVWFGMTWSLELYTQTVDRLFRQGQKAGTVSVVHIATEGTIDERIIKALGDKDHTQAQLIDAVKAVLS